LTTARATAANVKNFALQPVGVKSLMDETVFVCCLQNFFGFYKRNFSRGSSLHKFI
jgi:hypothetical protein